MKTMKASKGAPRDFECKLGQDLRDLIKRSMDLWAPHLNNEDLVNITLSLLAFCGAMISIAADAPFGTFAAYAETADEILRKKNIKKGE